MCSACGEVMRAWLGEVGTGNPGFHSRNSLDGKLVKCRQLSALLLARGSVWSLTSENSGLVPLPLQRYLSLNRLESKSEVCMIAQWPEELPASNLGGPRGGNDGSSY